MKKHMKVLGVLAVLCLSIVSVAFAAPKVDVGGMPLFFSATGTGDTDASTTVVTTVPGFKPDYVIIYQSVGTQANYFQFIKGMTQATSIKTVQSSGAETIDVAATGCGITTSTAGQITFTSNCFAEGVAYFVGAWRYAQ